MKLDLRTLVALAALALTACGGAAPPDEPAATASAMYRVTFRTDWTEAIFPTRFPANRHFSGLVGATHDDKVKFWDEDEPASPGIQSMAERGQKTPLLDEVNQALTAGHVGTVLSGGGIATADTQVMLDFTVTQTHPLVTLVSMVAPSPDWFVGVRKLALFQANQWQEKVTVPLEVYDAGTDDGASFASPDLDARPHVPVRTLTSASADTDFLAGLHRATGRAVGTFTFERLR